MWQVASLPQDDCKATERGCSFTLLTKATAFRDQNKGHHTLLPGEPEQPIYQSHAMAPLLWGITNPNLVEIGQIWRLRNFNPASPPYSVNRGDWWSPPSCMCICLSSSSHAVKAEMAASYTYLDRSSCDLASPFNTLLAHSLMFVAWASCFSFVCKLISSVLKQWKLLTFISAMYKGIPTWEPKLRNEQYLNAGFGGGGAPRATQRKLINK